MMRYTENIHPTDKIILVLLIEDVISEQNSIMQAVLQKGGGITDFTIMTASSLKDGLTILKQQPIDVVLLDLDLPDTKHLNAISAILHHFPDTPIVILSGHAEEAITTEALLMGAQEFLVKGECSGVMIKHTIYQAITRNSINKQKQEALQKAV